MKDCTFCEIVRGRRKGYAVFEDDVSLAFLDKRPLFAGHCLLVPKVHVRTLSDLPVSLVGPLFENARLLARAVETGMKAEGTFVALNNKISQSVPHLHVHIVPRRKKDGLRGFFWPRNPYKDERSMIETQIRLQKQVMRLVSRP